MKEINVRGKIEGDAIGNTGGKKRKRRSNHNTQVYKSDGEGG